MLNEQELESKLEWVYTSLTEDYLEEVENVMLKLSPAFATRPKEEVLELAKKMIQFRKVSNGK